MVYNEFKEQLTRTPSGWYETGLPWRGNHPPLNKTESIRRLQSLERRLQRKELVEDYNTVIEEQKQQGIVEPAKNKATGKEFYIPHKKSYESQHSQQSCEWCTMPLRRTLQNVHS